MLYVEGLESGIIDLNDGVTHYDFKIYSRNNDGIRKPFSVDLVTSQFIKAIKYGTNSLSIIIDVVNILEEEYVVLRNTANEVFEIKIVPNSYITSDKIYKFKVTKKIIEEDGSLKVKIFSKVNDSELGWKCTYDGKPMDYVITPCSNDFSCFVEIKPNTEVVSDFETVVEFTQDESRNVIRLKILNTLEGIKKVD